MAHNYVTVIGAGAFGTAIASLIADNGHWVCLYTHETDVAAQINQEHINTKYLSDAVLPPNVWATTDVAQAASGELLFVAIPVPYLREVLAPFRKFITIETTMVMLCKGIEAHTGLLPHQIVGETVGPCQFGVVGGPNFAADLTRRTLMGAMAASLESDVAQRIFALLNNSYVRISLSSDLVGVQLCGALKNVIALGVGFLTGQGASDNTRAYVLTSALQEIAVIVVALGGRRSTVFSLAGVGDVVLSSLSSQGRNYRLGMLLGQGKLLDQAVAMFASPPEGLNTVRAVQMLIKQHKLDLPVLAAICGAIMNGTQLAL